MNLEKLYEAKARAIDEALTIQQSGGDLSKLVSISEGNSKMGKVASVSLLPVLSCPARCRGTCGDKCYAKKLAMLRPVVMRAYARNQAVAMIAPTVFFSVVERAMKRSKYFRFHVSGDILNYEYLNMVYYLAKTNPGCQVLMFTKKYELVNRFIEYGNELPENLHILYSGWTNLFPTEGGFNPHNLPETTVYAREEDIKPEWTLCGGNCLDCAIHDGGCWTAKPGETIAFKIH